MAYIMIKAIEDLKTRIGPNMVYIYFKLFI